MTFARLAIAVWVCAGTAAVTAATQAPLGAAVTIHVAVEHPQATTSTQPAVPKDSKVIPTLSFAPWVLETGLTRDDFAITANGFQVPVATCEPAGGPASLVVLLDASASMEQTFPESWLPEALGRLFARTAEMGDRVVVGRVGGGATRLSSGFVTEASVLKNAAREVLTPTDADKAALLYGLEASPVWDAVDRAVSVLELVSGRRAVILFTDGRSSANVHGVSDVVRHAVAAGVSINVLSTAQEEVIPQSGATAARIRPGVIMEGMAASSGGAFIQVWQRALFTDRAGEASVTRAVAALMARMVDEVHGGYALTFFPSSVDTAFHPLKVRVTKAGLRIRAPSGYRLARESR